MLQSDLARTPDTLEDLKFVLKTISNIQDMTLDVEMQTRDIKERCVVFFKLCPKVSIVQLRNVRIILLAHCNLPTDLFGRVHSCNTPPTTDTVRCRCTLLKYQRRSMSTVIPSPKIGRTYSNRADG